MVQTTGQADTTEIELSPAMIDAGVRELLFWLGDVVSESQRSLTEKVVTSVFCEMEDAHRRTRLTLSR